MINGKNIKQFNIYGLRKQIGLVSQEPSLFIGTVAQNIRYNSNCTEKQIEEAIKISHAQKFISGWEEGTWSSI